MPGQTIVNKSIPMTWIFNLWHLHQVCNWTLNCHQIQGFKFRIKLKILHVFCVSIELLEIYILNIISQANHYLAIYWRSRRLGQYCLDGLKCHNQKLNFNEVIPADLIRGESFRSSLFLPIHIAEHPNNSHQWYVNNWTAKYARPRKNW